MSLPPELMEILQVELGAVVNVTAVGGGDISSAARIQRQNGPEALVKWHRHAPAGMFTAERRGLELLLAALAALAVGTLRVPRVLAQREAAAGCPAFIAMEWLGRGAGSTQAAQMLGQGLAQMHRVTGPYFGLDHDNFIGANPQPNRPGDDWITFFGERRLGFQMELAAQNGRLPRQRAQRLEKLLARLADWLPANPPASLLHGDLWGGNWLTTRSGQPALIDPAVYYGHREAELAFTELFGGFPGPFYAAYNQTWPPDQGYNERKDLYNLYHLLNHLNLFGESYGGSVDAVLRRYVG